jgi:hypothetical protein
VRLFDEEGAEPDWSACEVGEAHFSPDRVYRYALTRTWDERRPLGLIIGLGTTKGGYPNHPLYLPSDTQLTTYTGRR